MVAKNPNVTTPRNPNQLNNKKRFQLADWIREKQKNADWRSQTKLTLVQAATSELGFVVNEQNLSTIAIALGIRLPCTIVKKASSTAVLKEQIAKMEQRIVVLEKNLVALHKSLGQDLTVPLD